MIKLKGYYQEEPLLFEDSVGNNDVKGYLHKAYYFLDDKTYTGAGKQINIIFGTGRADKFDFQISDFDSSTEKYEIKNGKLLLYFNTGTPWEITAECIIIDDKKFIINGKIAIFKEF